MNDDQKRQFARHLMLNEIGEAGQEKIFAASVLMIGAGGLGAAALSYLTAAGVGRLGIVDHDHVELSNLQRQMLFEHGDIGRLKVEAAADRISELNPQCHVDVYAQRLTEMNAKAIISRYDLVLDGTDNFETRVIVADMCAELETPLIHAAVTGMAGYITTFTPYDGTSPSYRCFMPNLPEEPNRCSDVGVLGPMVGMVGSAQAVEAIKEVCGMGCLRGNILHLDGKTWRTRLSELPRMSDCLAN